MHREMYLSFMLATFRNGKNSFLNKCEEKLRKKLLLPLKNVAKNKRKIFFSNSSAAKLSSYSTVA